MPYSNYGLQSPHLAHRRQHVGVRQQEQGSEGMRALVPHEGAAEAEGREVGAGAGVCAVSGGAGEERGMRCRG